MITNSIWERKRNTMIGILEYEEIRKQDLSTKEINDRTIELIKLYKKESDKAHKKELMNQILALCDKIIGMNVSKLEFICNSFTKEDMYNEGIIITMKAIEKYEPDNDYNAGFVTYLTHALQKSLKRKINYNDQMIVIPEYKLIRESKLRRENESKGIDVPENTPVTVSLDSISENLWEDNSRDDEFDKEKGTDVLNQSMSVLSNVEKYIILKKHDLDETGAATFVQLEEILGISQSQISKIYRNAIKKLKLAMEDSGYDSFSCFCKGDC